MTNKKTPLGLKAGCVCACLTVLAQMSYADEEIGFKYNNLSISPYVNLEYTYNSNVDYSRTQKEDDHIFSINPGVDLNYKGNDWGFNANAWYDHDYYYDNDRLDKDSFGESVDFYWESPKGLKLLLGQRYVNASQSDSLSANSGSGNGLWRDRDQLDITGALSYQFSEKTSATLSGLYSDMSYENDSNRYGGLYGWTQYSVGLQLARQLTAKSDALISGSYQQYDSDGARGGMDSSSIGYTLMAGVGSRATERIKYSLQAGAAWFDYAKGDQMVGFVYEGHVSWLMSKKWALSLAGTSNFQPSEREVNQAEQLYVVSSSLTYKTTRRLTTSLDLAYRREEKQINTADARDGDGDDRYSARLMARYKLRKYVNLYAGLEYEEQFSDQKNNEFNRYRGTLGLNLRY
ncbi:MAG: outer membrane beta-barrel protein [Kiritimatiellae bacterium]|nr:outer membrane beta-barrel protein [Kiritimatiellia bacterium]